jgi:hypothetical protein
MSFVNKLFLRVPSYVSPEYIANAVDDMRVCSVSSISMKTYPKYSTAVVTIDRWYRDTQDIRDILNRGEPIYIPTGGYDLIAQKFVPKKTKSIVCVDEFGRDMPRNNVKNKQEKKQTSVDPALSSRDAENAKAAEIFIANYASSNATNALGSLYKNAREYINKTSDLFNKREAEARANNLYAVKSHCDDDHAAFYEGTDILSDLDLSDKDECIL